MDYIHDLSVFEIKGKTVIEHLVLNNGMSYWWMTLLVEKGLYNTPISSVLRLFAIEEIILQTRPNTLQIVGAEPIIARSIKNICHKYQVQFIVNKLKKHNKKINLKFLYKKLPLQIQSVVTLLRYLYQYRFLQKLKNTTWFSGDDAIFFCSYFNNIDDRCLKQGVFYSQYWQSLHKLLDDAKIKTNWLQLYVPNDAVPNYKTALKLLNWINHKNDTQWHAFIHNYFDLTIFWHVCKQWLWLNVKSWHLRSLKEKLWPISFLEWSLSIRGPIAIQNLLFKELFNKALKGIPYQHKGFYLCENQAWERALIYSWRQYQHGTLIGVAHSTVRYWDLRYFTAIRTIKLKNNSIPLPDLLAVNGKIALSHFQKIQYPQHLIVECEALRYSYLKKYQAIKYNVKQDKKILIFGDYHAAVNQQLFAMLTIALTYCTDKMYFYIKPHPNCSVNIIDFESLKLTLVTESINTILKEFDMVYASNVTSAAVDSYFYGLPTIIMLDKQDLNFSPLREQFGVSFVSTPKELATALHATHTNKKTKADDFFFFDPIFTRWMQLIKN